MLKRSRLNTHYQKYYNSNKLTLKFVGRLTMNTDSSRSSKNINDDLKTYYQLCLEGSSGLERLEGA